MPPRRSGSKFKGRAAGTFGVAGAISFYPAKTLGCLGDGGCAMTNDDDVREKLLLLRDHGRDRTSATSCSWGLNSRLDNLQAAILNHQLKGYDQVMARRREIAASYQRQLGGLAQVRLPPAPDDDRDHFDIFQNYEIEAERRDALRAVPEGTRHRHADPMGRQGRPSVPQARLHPALALRR